LGGVSLSFSEKTLREVPFLFCRQLADIQCFEQTHQASASLQKSSINWTCSLRNENGSQTAAVFVSPREIGPLRSPTPHPPCTPQGDGGKDSPARLRRPPSVGLTASNSCSVPPRHAPDGASALRASTTNEHFPFAVPLRSASGLRKWLPGAKWPCFAPGNWKYCLPGANWGVFAPGKVGPGTKWGVFVPGR